LILGVAGFGILLASIWVDSPPDGSLLALSFSLFAVSIVFGAVGLTQPKSRGCAAAGLAIGAIGFLLFLFPLSDLLSFLPNL
jgi:hypothetical protein